MRSLIATFVWLRWRLLINSLRGGRRQDVMDRLSRVASLLAPILLMGFFGLAAMVLAGLGFAAGILVAGEGADAGTVRAVLLAVRLMLFVVTAVLVMLPLGRSLQGGFPGTERLLLLPIPRGLLHFIDVAAGLFDPWLAFLLPGLLALVLGVLVSGRAVSAAILLAAGLALLATLACLSGLATFFMQWVLRDRRRGEAAALIFTVLIIAVSMIPSFLMRKTGTGREVHIALPSGVWGTFLPSELFARVLRAGVEGRAGMAALGVGALLAEGAALFWISSRVHARLLTTTAASTRGGKGIGLLRERTGPGWVPPAAAAVARAQVTTALRTLRGRMAVFLNAPLLLALGFMMHHISGVLEGHNPVGFVVDGPSLFGMGVMLSLLSLQPILMNQFASDRSGLTLQLLSPVSERDLLMGKAWGGLRLIAMSNGLCLAAAWVASPSAAPLLWLCAAAAGAATIFLAAPVAAFFSVLFPRRADLTKMGSAGNAHPMSALLGTLVVMVAAVPGSALLLAGSWLGMPALAAAAALVWMALCGMTGWATVCVLAPVLQARRENLLLVAAGG